MGADAVHAATAGRERQAQMSKPPQHEMIELVQKRILRELRKDDCAASWVDRAMAFVVKLPSRSVASSGVEEALARLKGSRPFRPAPPAVPAAPVRPSCSWPTPANDDQEGER